MKKIKYILSSAILTVFLFGCDAEQASQDAADIISTDGYPTASFTLTGGSTTFNERSEPVFTYDIVLDKPIDRPIDFSWVVLGGDAELHEDYDVVNGTVAAFTTTGQISITFHNDTEIENTETLKLTVESGPSLANKYLLNPSTPFPTLDITIQDYKFCLWTLVTSDTYGDGWNGGKIEVTSEGVTTEYIEAADGPTTFEILITQGEDYSFEYISGGGGFCGSPGYECENYFKLTSPDGTVWEEGAMDYSGAPTEGVITSGTCE